MYIIEMYSSEVMYTIIIMKTKILLPRAVDYCHDVYDLWFYYSQTILNYLEFQSLTLKFTC